MEIIVNSELFTPARSASKLGSGSRIFGDVRLGEVMSRKSFLEGMMCFQISLVFDLKQDIHFTRPLSSTRHSMLLVSHLQSVHVLRGPNQARFSRIFARLRLMAIRNKIKEELTSCGASLIVPLVFR